MRPIEQILKELTALGDDYPTCNEAVTAINELRNALTQISDPLLLNVDGVGMTKALATIAKMRDIAQAALTSGSGET